MRGQIISVWRDTWKEIWKPLTDHPEFGDDLIPDLYRELIPVPTVPEVPVPMNPLDQDGELVHADDIAARDAYDRHYAGFREELATYEETEG